MLFLLVIKQISSYLVKKFLISNFDSGGLIFCKHIMNQVGHS